MAKPPIPSVRGPAAPTPRASSDDVLVRIEQRLAVLEERTAWIDDARVMVPRVTATAGDIVDDLADRHQLEGRTRAALAVLEQLTRPQVLEALGNAGQLALRLPELAATLGDTADDYARSAEAAGVELDTLLPRLGRLTTQVAVALQGAERAEPAPKGLLATLRALKDPDVRRALGFVLGLAKEFGRVSRPTTQRALNGSKH